MAVRAYNPGPWRPDYATPGDPEYPMGPLVREPDADTQRGYRWGAMVLLGLTLWALCELGIGEATRVLLALGWS